MTAFVEHVKEKLIRSLDATVVEIIDDSWKHAGHAANRGPYTDGTHLQISIVSERFRDMPIIEQHRLIHTILKDEMAERIHALSLKTQAPN